MTGLVPAPVPLYAQIAQRLMREIAEGVHAMGSRLPTEEALCERFGVSRITVRAALKELQIRGVVSRRAGIGTVVQRSTARERFVQEAGSVDDAIAVTRGMRLRILSSRPVVADLALAARLRCPVGAAFVEVQALREPPVGPPVCLSVHHVPVDLAGAVATADGQFGSLALHIAVAAGTTIVAIRQEIDAQALDAVEAKRLSARPREAALATMRWYEGEDGRLIVATRSLYPRGRYTLGTTLRREAVLEPAARRRAM
jgi:DNA-binding GntR family transcriptional regulator